MLVLVTSSVVKKVLTATFSPLQLASHTSPYLKRYNGQMIPRWGERWSVEMFGLYWIEKTTEIALTCPDQFSSSFEPAKETYDHQSTSKRGPTCFAMVLWTRRGSPAPEPLVCSISSARVPPGHDHKDLEDDGIKMLQSRCLASTYQDRQNFQPLLVELLYRCTWIRLVIRLECYR